MDLIDEKGRLFGVVNVVDALVVLLVVAVAVAGASLVLGKSPGQDADRGTDEAADLETRTVTLAFGQRAPQLATLVEPGPVNISGVNATITDVYRTPAGGENVLVFVRLQVPGRATEAGFIVNGTAIRYGSKITVETPQYTMAGTVDALHADDGFDTARRSVTVETNVTRAVGNAITVGDRHRIGDVAVATVTDVVVRKTNENRRTLSVTLELRGLVRGETFSYAGRPVRLGSRLTVQTPRYQFTGEVVDIEDA